jgi:formylglycine-generating enzyme required for sulfatase activity
MKAQHITFAILLILVTAGCSDKDDKLPVAPNGNTYDPELMALIPAGTFRMGNITEHGRDG